MYGERIAYGYNKVTSFLFFAVSAQIMSKKMAGGVVFRLWVLLFVGCLQQCRGLITTFLGKECVYEEVEYDGDLVSGNFVVMDHGLTWSNDDPSIELLVFLLFLFQCMHCAHCVVLDFRLIQEN